jgi:hypothetical protein
MSTNHPYRARPLAPSRSRPQASVVFVSHAVSDADAMLASSCLLRALRVGYSLGFSCYFVMLVAKKSYVP